MPKESWSNRKTLILSRTDMMGLVTPSEYVECVEQACREAVVHDDVTAVPVDGGHGYGGEFIHPPVADRRAIGFCQRRRDRLQRLVEECGIVGGCQGVAQIPRPDFDLD